MQDYSTKPSGYFSNPRREIEQLLPPAYQRVLEIGCGSGQTLKWLKSRRPSVTTTGVEINSSIAKEAAASANSVHCLDIEKQELPDELIDIDLLLCLDVLEHLVDPWSVLARLHSRVSIGGVIIASLPNVRYFRALFPLIIQGRWDYAPCGVLDKTHLRFFTQRTGKEMLARAGFSIEQIIPVRNVKSQFVSKLSFGLLGDLLTERYLIKALKK